MIIGTKALVLHCQPFQDNRYIVHLYTEESGRINYLVHFSSNKKATNKRAFFQPLTLIEIQADHKGSRQLQTVKEVRLLYPFSDLPFRIEKQTMALFLSEVLYRTLNEAEKNESLFEFLSQSVQMLDLCMNGLANFHLVFLIKLTRFLGFYPNLEDNQPEWYFDLLGGVFVPARPVHNAWLSPEDAAQFARLMQINYENMTLFRFNHHQRRDILKQMLNYYRLHLTDFPVIKSMDVLETVFANQPAS